MARRPKRTYNEETGKWEVDKFYDTRDDQGRYWKDGIQVDRYGEPWKPMTDEQAAANTSTPGTGVGGGELPEVGDESIDIDDPRNLIMGSSNMSLLTGESRSRGIGQRGEEGSMDVGSPALRRGIEVKRKLGAGKSLINKGTL